VNNWKVIFATVVIFGAGVLTGGLLVNYVQHSHYRPPHKAAAAPASHAPVTNVVARPADNEKPRLPEVLSRQFLQQLDENLRLAPEQHEAIQKIINEGQNQMRKAVQDARLEIREVLTPGQRNQFDDLVKRPFHKPIFETNSLFQGRPNQLLERPAGTRAVEPLSPEARMILLETERERAKLTNMTSVPSPLPSLTNAP
jgi:uncharacterized membrane protein